MSIRVAAINFQVTLSGFLYSVGVLHAVALTQQQAALQGPVDSYLVPYVPEMPSKFLKEMGYPEDTSAFAYAARQWFSRIDLDGSGDLDCGELVQEFLRIGLAPAQAQHIMRFHTSHPAATLDVNAFIDTLLHILGNSVPSFLVREPNSMLLKHSNTTAV